MKANKLILLYTFTALMATADKTEASLNPSGVPVMQPVTDAQPADISVMSSSRMDWWHQAKFGMFIHWGVYSVPAGLYHGKEESDAGEWIMNRDKIPMAEYQLYAKQFDPTNFSADAWVKIARDAGMKYIIITAKHHDGFAMWPTKASKWNIYDATPWHHDPLKQLAEACRKQGIRLGFYYSQGQDWNNGGAVAGGRWDPAQQRDMDAYVDKIAVPQVKELMTRYGPDVPAIIWWDTPIDINDERAEKLYQAARTLKPNIIMNGRLGGSVVGDYETPEQYVPIVGYPGHSWETCMTINDTWGYKKNDHNWKSAGTLIRDLCNIASKGGNFLLNVGPTSTGIIPAPEAERLTDIGRWLRVNGAAIYGTSAGPFPYLSWGVATRKGERLYLHVFTWPEDGKLHVPLKNHAKSAWLLDAPDARLSISTEPGDLIIHLPRPAPDTVDSVVALDLVGDPATVPLPSAGATASASAWLTNAIPAYAVDGTDQKAWRAPKSVKSAWLKLNLGKPKEVTGFGFDAPDVWPRLEQRFTLEAFTQHAWRQVAGGITHGYGVQQTIPPITAQQFRLTMECDTGSPGVAEIQLYGKE